MSGDKQRFHRAVAIAVAMVSLSTFGAAIGDVAPARAYAAVVRHSESDDLRYRARIGARQPRPQDLPPSVLRDEGHVTKSQSDFDKTLQICQPC
jgi:hypothetical protein